jgi:hypothetical protein
LAHAFLAAADQLPLVVLPAIEPEAGARALAPRTEIEPDTRPLPEPSKPPEHTVSCEAEPPPGAGGHCIDRVSKL